MNSPATIDTTAWSRFEPRMRRVLDHVYAHLDAPLDLLTLAEIAHLQGRLLPAAGALSRCRTALTSPARRASAVAQRSR